MKLSKFEKEWRRKLAWYNYTEKEKQAIYEVLNAKPPKKAKDTTMPLFPDLPISRRKV